MAYTISAEKRDGVGKSVTRKLRADHKIPAVLYGTGNESLPLVVARDEVGRVLSDSHARSSVITLTVRQDGQSADKNVLIKEIQRHPVGDFIFHVDFLEVSMDKEITLNVPVELSGTAEGIKMGGILQFMARELKVTCLPANIPAHIPVDITPLQMGDSIHVKDLTAPEGVKLVFDSNFTIVSVVSPAAEEVAAVTPEGEAAAAAAAASTAKAEPEVIGKGKKELEEE